MVKFRSIQTEKSLIWCIQRVTILSKAELGLWKRRCHCTRRIWSIRQRIYVGSVVPAKYVDGGAQENFMDYMPAKYRLPYRGRTPLNVAAEEGHSEMVE